ncbi:MAG TPA: TetR/AcrR family transcriptional regulator [Thermoanaerobaculia bacterium]|nr:TetR/AcrR family transcriptional regulator [Thermoanaerobaculia bacterium]
MDPTPKSTRERLVESALYLFWLKGYEATSITDILDRARANAGSFYHFFKRKEDLLLAVLQRYAVSLDLVIVDPVRERYSDPIERVFGILEFYRRNLVATDCSYGCPIGRLALEIAPEQEEVHRRLAGNFDGWTAAVERLLADAGDRFPPGTNLAGLATFVLTVMEGGVMQARAHRDLAPFDASVAQLRDYFRLLTGGPPRSAHDDPRDQADGFTALPASTMTE